MQSQMATPRDHMQYQPAAAFNAESMAMGRMGQQIPMPRQGPAPAAGMPTIPPGYRGNTPYDGVGMSDMEMRAPYRPGVAPIPGMTKRLSPDFGDMTDEEMQAMYMKLSGMGAFDPDTLQGY